MRKKKPLSRSSSWSELADGLLSSPNPDEQEHYFGGWLHGTDYPLLISPDSRNGHVAVFGSTRSGKTARFMLPLAAQAIPRHNSVLWFDHKGDEAVCASLQIFAKKAGVPSRFFALEPRKPSYLFQVFLQKVWSEFSVNEKTQVLTASLGLSRLDQQSGASYFDGNCEMILQKSFELRPDMRSIREVSDFISTKRFRVTSGFSRKDLENGGALYAHLRRLAPIWQLNAVPGDGYPDAVFRDAIDVESWLTTPSVTYFWLPASIEQTTGRTVTRLAIRLLSAAARMRHNNTTHLYVFIDEFQEVQQHSLMTPLRQLADKGVSFVLAQQTMSDLETGE